MPHILPLLAALGRSQLTNRFNKMYIFDVERLVAASENIVGKLDTPNTGIMFTVLVAGYGGCNRRASKANCPHLPCPVPRFARAGSRERAVPGNGVRRSVRLCTATIPRGVGAFHKRR